MIKDKTMIDYICPHCKMDKRIRNPSGFCDHLNYPENCNICKNITKKISDYKNKYNKFLTEEEDEYNFNPTKRLEETGNKLLFYDKRIEEMKNALIRIENKTNTLIRMLSKVGSMVENDKTNIGKHKISQSNIPNGKKERKSC